VAVARKRLSRPSEARATSKRPVARAARTTSKAGPSCGWKRRVRPNWTTASRGPCSRARRWASDGRLGVASRKRSAWRSQAMRRTPWAVRTRASTASRRSPARSRIASAPRSAAVKRSRVWKLAADRRAISPSAVSAQSAPRTASIRRASARGTGAGMTRGGLRSQPSTCRRSAPSTQMSSPLARSATGRAGVVVSWVGARGAKPKRPPSSALRPAVRQAPHCAAVSKT
jgi:hypothetical protein